jgi:hypothetical protein
MNPNDPFPTEGIGEFMSAMGWTPPQGGPSNAVPSRQPKKKVCVVRKNPNFSPNEDISLVKNYLEVSCDPVVNTNQKKESLWSRIMNLYNKKRGHYPERTTRSAQSRWDTIKLEVGKFCSYYSNAMTGNHSGFTDADKVFFYFLFVQYEFVYKQVSC